MKYFRQLCASIVLVCILTVSGLAGDIHCGVVDEPPATSQETVTGDMPNGVEPTDTVTEIVISLLVNILPLI